MVDYVPLIARAVATLNPNTSEKRQALYDRARKTLVDQLRINDPALSHTDLKAESAALEVAIQRVERDAARRAAPPRPAPMPARETSDTPSGDYQDRPPLEDTGKKWRIAAGAIAAALVLIGGVAAYSFLPRTLSEVRAIAPSPRNATVAEEPADAKSGYVRLRQLVYYRTNQPVGTIVVDKSQAFLYVVRPNVSALRYNIGVGSECATLAGLFHIVRKEEPSQQPNVALGARVLYLDKDYRIHGSNTSAASGRSVVGCIRLVDDDVIYLYDRTPLESRVVVSN
jgi:hypothetical protein